uniref:Uncharacterized protein n=1 Tax=Fagus sylvatica TaxID=28930 RepID=A0A2N9I8N8_FAGSY
MAELDLFVSLQSEHRGFRLCSDWRERRRDRAQPWVLLRSDVGNGGWGWGIGVEEIENQMEERESVEETAQRRDGEWRRERVSDGGERKS